MPGLVGCGKDFRHYLSDSEESQWALAGGERWESCAVIRFLLLWQNIHGMEFTILTTFKWTVQWH